MTDRDGLLKAIRSGDGRLVELIYADCLAESGRLDEADLLRADRVFSMLPPALALVELSQYRDYLDAPACYGSMGGSGGYGSAAHYLSHTSSAEYGGYGGDGHYGGHGGVGGIGGYGGDGSYGGYGNGFLGLGGLSDDNGYGCNGGYGGSGGYFSH